MLRGAMQAFRSGALKGATWVATKPQPAIRGSVRSRLMSTVQPAQDKETPIINSGMIAGVALAGVGLWVGLDAVMKKRNNVEFFAVQQWEEVENQAAVAKIREERLMEGLKDACFGAFEWGIPTGLFLYLMKTIERPVFKSDVLARAGAPRLVLATMAMATCGFAIKGETTLIRQARRPVRVRPQE